MMLFGLPIITKILMQSFDGASLMIGSLIP